MTRKKDKRKRFRRADGAPSQSKARGVKHKLNLWVCQVCAGSIVTVELCDGITPPVIVCHASDDCAGMMTTNFYHVPRSFEPTFEFYRPAPTEMFKATDAARRHYETGGLFLRPIKKKIKIIGFDPARDADESVAVVKIKLSSGGEQTFTFDKREIDAMKAGEPLNWERIANSGVLPDGARLPSNIRRAVIGKLLESFEI